MSHIVLVRPKGIADWMKLYRLYLSAFPREERKPFGIIVKMYRQGKSHIWCIRRGEEFLGMATTINGDALILLDYFAIEKTHRGEGIGTAAMLALQEQYQDKGLFVEIESTLEAGPEQLQRLKRKHFYMGVGMEDLHTRANVFGVPMELMGVRCSLVFAGYQAFYRTNYGTWAAEHLLPIPGEQ